MTFSKLFARCAYFGSRGSSQSSHHPNKQSIGFSNQTHGFHWSNIQTKRALNKSSTMQKIKDTILLMEATKGPTTKATIGTCQGLGTAAMVFGTGYTIALLTCGLEENPQRHPLLTDIQLENGANAVLDTASIRSYLEERRKIIDERISLTYFHIVSSLVAAGLTSVLSFRMFKNKAFLVQIANRPMVAVGAGVITPFLMGYVVRSLPRTPNPDGNMIPFGMKELGHLLYAGSLGLVAAPLYLLGGHSMVRAAYVTAGCFAGLHGVSKVIPRTALLEQEAPLVIAVNAVLVSFLMTLFLRPGHPAFMPLYRFMMHGGLVVYSLSYLHALQKMEQTARSRLYDPINASMSCTMAIFNIFGRLAFMLPPYFQVCRDHLLIMPTKQRVSPFRKHTTKKPEDSGTDGSGSGNQM